MGLKRNEKSLKIQMIIFLARKFKLNLFIMPVWPWWSCRPRRWLCWPGCRYRLSGWSDGWPGRSTGWPWGSSGSTGWSWWSCWTIPSGINWNSRTWSSCTLWWGLQRFRRYQFLLLKLELKSLLLFKFFSELILLKPSLFLKLLLSEMNEVFLECDCTLGFDKFC